MIQDLPPRINPRLRGLASIAFKDPLLSVLVVLTGILLLAGATPPVARFSALISWPTISTLAGLMVITAALSDSGALRHVGASLLRTLGSERRIALVLVALSAFLSMAITNDVALFVVVPLTLSLAPSAELPIERLVIFEALAVNAGSLLTVVGNPQNLFIWQHFGLTMLEFSRAMLPLFLACFVTLVAATVVAFPARQAKTGAEEPARLDWRQFLIALAVFIPFLVLSELHHPALALALCLVIAIPYRKTIFHIDWGLLLAFVLMFFDLNCIARAPSVHELLTNSLGSSPYTLFTVAALASQLISNVPATILFAPFTADWRILAIAVNVGGFGLVVGSMANLIALRLLNRSGAWLRFHLYSIPFFVFVAALALLTAFFGAPANAGVTLH